MNAVNQAPGAALEQMASALEWLSEVFPEKAGFWNEVSADLRTWVIERQAAMEMMDTVAADVKKGVGDEVEGKDG